MISRRETAKKTLLPKKSGFYGLKLRGKFDFVNEKNLGPAIAEPKFYCAHQDLNLEPIDYESIALTN